MLTPGRPSAAVLAPRDGAFAPILASVLEEQLGLSPETLGLSLDSHGLGVDNSVAPRRNGCWEPDRSCQTNRLCYQNANESTAFVSAATSTTAALANDTSDRSTRIEHVARLARSAWCAPTDEAFLTFDPRPLRH
jgi:hypothetical protein